MTNNTSINALAANDPWAKIVSLISDARADDRAARSTRGLSPAAPEYGDCWYHDDAIRGLKEAH